MGDEVELRLDYAGKVYDSDKVKGGLDSFAVMLQTSDIDLDLKGGDAAVKLFLADGTDKIFDVDDDIDNDLISNGDWESGYENKDGAGTVVEYSLDKNGVIDSIKVAIAKDATLILDREMTSGGYYNRQAVNSDAVLFTYDGKDTDSSDDKADEDNYGVTTVAKVSGKDLSARYALKDGKINVMLIVGSVESDEDIYGIPVGREITSDSSTDYQLTLWIDGKKVDYDVTKSVYDSFGGSSATRDYITVYKLKLNSNDAISDLTELSAYDETKDEGEILYDFIEATAYSSGRLTIVDPDDADKTITVTINTSGYAYKLDGSEYDKASVNRSSLVGNKVMLIDTNEDGVADLFLID